MTVVQRYILNELKVMKKECLEKNIAPRKWVEKYAEKYHHTYWDSNNQNLRTLKRKECLNRPSRNSLF